VPSIQDKIILGMFSTIVNFVNNTLFVEDVKNKTKIYKVRYPYVENHWFMVFQIP